MCLPESQEWMKAKAEEIMSLESRGTWEIALHPENTNVVSCKWGYWVKYGANGEVTHYKARLIATALPKSMVWIIPKPSLW